MKFGTKGILRWLALAPFALGLLLCFGARTFASPTAHDLAVPRYSHIFVIVEENKDYGQIMDPSKAPNIARLAKTYGIATRFYAEVHPSEGNYVAIVSGDTYGIHDDDAYFCRPGSKNVLCEKVGRPGYVNHTITEPHIGTQLEQAGLTWKGYYESIPSGGSLATTAGDTAFGAFARTWQLYASKHSGFINFASVQHSPHRAQELVDFDRLDADLASGHVPSFALVVPNQCNDMHGLDPTDYPASIASHIPADCNHDNAPGLISRGDAQLKKLVDKIQASPVWKAPQNVAIVITFDEGSSDTPLGCCGIDPKSTANFGGGHIPTIIITNHGPRGVSDATPYSHYSLLRTIEDAFGIHEYLGHSAETAKGVTPMVPLFKKP